MKRIIALAVVLVLLSTWAWAGSPRVTVEKEKYQRALSLFSGAVRNKEARPIKGSIRIMFLDDKGKVKHTQESLVNDGKEIPPGKSGRFRFKVQAGDMDGVEGMKWLFLETQ